MTIPAEKKEKKLTRYFLEFSKLGLLKFIGHIDTLKYFERLFFVSGISIFFTEGFNPHAKLQFCNPLPLGIESECEILEFFTNYEYDEKELSDTLKFYENKNLSINRVKKVSYEKKISLTNEIYSTLYTLNFDKSQFELVKKSLENFKNDNLSYSFERNGKIFSGIYSKYIDFLNLMNNNVIIEIKNVTEVPKLRDAIVSILGSVDFGIVKKSIYGFQNGSKIIVYAKANFDADGTFINIEYGVCGC